MNEIELPEDFSDRPLNEQLAYLEHTGTKRAVIQAFVDLVDADVHPGGASSGLRKRQWAKLLVAAREALDDE